LSEEYPEMPSINITQRFIDSLKVPAGRQFIECWDSVLSGFLVRMQPRGTKTFYFEYRGQEKRLNEKTGKEEKARKRIRLGTADALTVAEARVMAEELKGDLFHGVDPATKKEEEKRLAEEAKKAAEEERRQAEEEKKAAEANTYLNFLKTRYYPLVLKDNPEIKSGEEIYRSLEKSFEEFHNKPLSEITALDVETWQKRRLVEGKRPSTINRQMNDLRAMLNWAVRKDLLPASPFANKKIKPYKIDKNPKARFLSSNEEKSLRAELDAREAAIRERRESFNQWREERDYPLYDDLSGCGFADYLKPAVLLSLNTGMRRGELFGLQWRDVDLEKRILTVVGEGAKSGQTRHIPLNDEALAILKQWKAQPGVKSIGGYVFSGKDGDPLQNLRKSFMEVLRKAKVNDFRWHDMRHSFASKLVMNGVDLNTVRELLGHGDYKMTLRYSHLAPEHKAAAVAKLVPPAEHAM
jgi:integrase